MTLTIDSLLGSDGFVRMKENNVENNVENNTEHNESDQQIANSSKDTIYETLHNEDPIKTLKKYGMFRDKKEIKYDNLEYVGKYKSNDNCAYYLCSRTYIFDKIIENNKIIINDVDVDFDCPLYYLSISFIDDENPLVSVPVPDPSVKLIFDNYYSIIVSFNGGYINDDNQNIYNIISENVSSIYKEIIELENKQHIFNRYTERIEIDFDSLNLDKREVPFGKRIVSNKVKVTCKVNDVYCYGGFFSSGWL